MRVNQEAVDERSCLEASPVWPASSASTRSSRSNTFRRSGMRYTGRFTEQNRWSALLGVSWRKTDGDVRSICSSSRRESWRPAAPRTYLGTAPH